MTKTDEIRALLDEHGIKYGGRKVTAGKGAYRRTYQKTTWRVGEVLYCYEEYPDGRTSMRAARLQINVEPERAVAASLGRCLKRHEQLEGIQA